MLMMVNGKFHPWLALTLAILAGAATLVLLLKGPGVTAPQPAAVGALTASQPLASGPVTATAVANPALTDRVSAEELEKFRRNRRSVSLHGSYPWITGARARDLFVSGHLREAIQIAGRELIARAQASDRDAQAVLLGLRDECDNSHDDWQRVPADLWTAQKTESLRNAIADLKPTPRAKAEILLDLQAEESQIGPSVCESLAHVDTVDLDEKVRQAAADGHTPSLATLAAMTPDGNLQERYLLSAALLGDTAAQLDLARLYLRRSDATPAPKDRGKARFWLEQAAGSQPAASFELGKCLIRDCDGQAANPSRARQLIESAAREGYPPAMAYMTRDVDAEEPGDKFTRYAWLEFRARLAEQGCYANAAYLVETNDEATRNAIRDSFLPGERGTAITRANELYTQYGAQVLANSGCN